MPYTIWSHGRMLGETDLGFVRCITKARMGWFHPSADGEKVMPIATGVSPALRAYVDRARHAPAEGDVVRRGMDSSTEAADLAAASQHLEALELELRDEAGAIVPTEDVGFQDTHFLAELADEIEDDCDEACEWRDGEELFLQKIERDKIIERSVEHDRKLLDEWFAENAENEGGGWTPDVELPRYQVLVQLFDDSAIP